jgi:hypothetical protein
VLSDQATDKHSIALPVPKTRFKAHHIPPATPVSGIATPSFTTYITFPFVKP